MMSIAIGAFGGLVAVAVGAPMPFLLGSFAASVVFAIGDFGLFKLKPHLPMPLRNLFVAVIGVMIGGNFHPGIFADADRIWFPALGILIFIHLAICMNFFIFRVIGGYDRPTAFFSSTPGGLIESVALGEKAGGDAQKLSLQQFLRISLVITVLPFIFQIWTGQKVGSAAGMSLATTSQAPGIVDWLVFTFCAIVGLYGGRMIRLPAALLIGPMILSGLAHYFGLVSSGPPHWVIATAQVIVGAGMGLRVKGFQMSRILQAFSLAVLSVSAMLALAALLVLLLSYVSDEPIKVLFLSFAPGGVTETALIALSLDANPVFVTTLHVFRIVSTVGVLTVGSRLVRKRD